MVTCGYCHTTTRVGSTQRRRAAQSPARARGLGIAIAGAVSVGAVAYLIAVPRSQKVVAPIERPRDVIGEQTDATVPQDAAIEDAAAAPQVVNAVREKRPKEVARVPTGPIVSKDQAEQILRPQVMACMKEHRAHYLITRLGNERHGANVPTLGLTGTSVLDYKPVPGFASTPLGRCIARAGSAVRAPAYGGNYIYFGLRNDDAPDPLAGAAEKLDHDAANKALAALDDEARDCARRNLAGSRPGETVTVMVTFQGATGKVSTVEPHYLDMRSAYGRCLSAVYRKASVEKFRDIDAGVVHVLAP